MARTRSRLMLCTMLALVLVLPGCFTMLLWGHDISDPGDGYVEAGASPDKVAGMPLPLRIFLTPFTVVLDICTLPFQLDIFFDDDADPLMPRECR